MCDWRLVREMHAWQSILSPEVWEPYLKQIMLKNSLRCRLGTGFLQTRNKPNTFFLHGCNYHSVTSPRHFSTCGRRRQLSNDAQHWSREITRNEQRPHSPDLVGGVSTRVL